MHVKALALYYAEPKMPAEVRIRANSWDRSYKDLYGGGCHDGRCLLHGHGSIFGDECGTAFCRRLRLVDTRLVGEREADPFRPAIAHLRYAASAATPGNHEKLTPLRMKKLQRIAG